MQNLTIYYSHSPQDIKHYSTEQLRSEFLVESLFVDNQVNIAYTYYDRMLIAGVQPTTEDLEVNLSTEIGSEYFLENRELGIINIGGPGVIEIDGKLEELAPRDGFYVSRGTRQVIYRSVDPQNPAKFYLASAPAHREYPTVRLAKSSITPLELGDKAHMNERKIYQYVHPNNCESCVLQMGLTELAEGSSWNTMPAHTHARRMEAYFYLDLPAEDRVFHFMGAPEETKHLVVANEQAVFSPNWSIHSGVGTSNYSFIWSMCGENKTYTDMDPVPPAAIK